MATSAAYEAHWCAFSDAAGALRSVARSGMLRAVLTNGDQDQQTSKLRAVGLLELSGPVFASSTIGAAKPDPVTYATVCRRLGVAPHEALMVGDNHALDVVAARAAGTCVLMGREVLLPHRGGLRISRWASRAAPSASRVPAPAGAATSPRHATGLA